MLKILPTQIKAFVDAEAHGEALKSNSKKFEACLIKAPIQIQNFDQPRLTCTLRKTEHSQTLNPAEAEELKSSEGRAQVS